MYSPHSETKKSDESTPVVLQNTGSHSKKKKKKKKKKNSSDASEQQSSSSSYTESGSNSTVSNCPAASALTDEYVVNEQTTIKCSNVNDETKELSNPFQEKCIDEVKAKAETDNNVQVDDVASHVERFEACRITKNYTREEKLPPKEEISDEKQSQTSRNISDSDKRKVSSDEGRKDNSPVSGKTKKPKKKSQGLLLSDLKLTEPQTDSDKQKNDDGVAISKAEKKLRDKNTLYAQSDLKKFSQEDELFTPKTEERNNFYKILTLLYSTGLETLRKLFLEIHPNWSNKLADAKKLDKGKMRLQSHEQDLFDTGNINKWDVSLITTVLLYSKKCYKALTKRKGFEKAIRTIKDNKNLLISHKDSERLTDDEFSSAWEVLSQSLQTIGASSNQIEQVHVTDDILESAKFYRDKFLEEVARSSVVQSQVNTIQSTVQDILPEVKAISAKVSELLSNKEGGQKEPKPHQKGLNGSSFTEWVQLCAMVDNFDYDKNNYMLITDAMSQECLQHFSLLRSVPWKIVLDFNPASEEHGMYHDFIQKEGKNSLFDMITPVEIRQQHSNLARNIDPLKTKWLFVKGREKDNHECDEMQTFEEWKKSSVKHITYFFNCCSQPGKLDSQKPLICFILPFREQTVPFVELTVDRLFESFDEFKLKLVAIKHEFLPLNLQEKFGIFAANLSSSELNSGLETLLKISSGKEYRLPTYQEKLSVNLKHDHFLYLEQYLEVLYDGCEERPTDLENESKREEFFDRHRESFLSGNWISFVSLHDEHDARREVGEEVKQHIQRLLGQGPTHSTIVEIRHLPGTGGTTIARRVLWDLHGFYPCAIARLDNCTHDFEEDVHFIDALADRICDIHETCGTVPLILLDGKHPRMEAFSNKLVRVLNSRGQRAVLLRCLHRSKQQSDSGTLQETNISGVNRQFEVQVHLEDSRKDLNQFKEKYRNYIDEFKKSTNLSLSRVFHFPLIAMLKGLEGFRPRLQQIINESFDEMDGLQKEVAALVAFIQHFAAQETPAFLLYKAFKSDKHGRKITYEEINHELITEQLLNLMIPKKPAKEVSSQASSSRVPEKYTLQHPVVADLVLRRYYTTQKRDVFSLARDFIEYPIFQDDQFKQLIDDLFIKRSHLPNERFSSLFEELKRLNARDAAEIFGELAEKTGDAVVFAHSALFHGKLNYFKEAISLISRALECSNAKARSRIIYDRKGQVLLSQMKFLIKKAKIKSISKLEGVAEEAITSFTKARNFPPTYASPLMGEVKVWIECIEWIAKNECGGDTDKAFEFITSTGPRFFHSCISNSLYLLDIVDSIVEKEPHIPEPAETQNQANQLRVSLLKTFNKNKVPGRKKKEHDIISACKALCSTDKFPNCSQDELKRLQVYFMLASVDQQIESLKKEEVHFLLNLLEDLVLKTQTSGFNIARHLMKVSLHISGPNHFSLDKGLRVASLWIQESRYDPQPYFFQMMINFLKILDGNLVKCRDSYNRALDLCRENSKSHIQGSFTTHFLKKSGNGMNRLMTRSTLLDGEPDYRKNLVDFWTTQSRKKLLECSGRIKQRQGKSKQVYIELLQGNIELYVKKNSDFGKVDRNFVPGSIVYFVVSFNLKGPVANGITFQKCT